MRLKSILLFVSLFLLNYLQAQVSENSKKNVVRMSGAVERTVMSEDYWKLWNPEVQSKIDQDIDLNRKANAVIQLKDVTKGTEVKVEQISHDFIFGAHIFNFNQLGTVERNQKYKDLYGTLFNSATIAFYWMDFEMQPNRPRFREEYWDTEAYWNQVKEPALEPHWRRPATDPVVEFCEMKGIRLHGHTMTWGSLNAQLPVWVFEKFCPEEEKDKFKNLSRDELTPARIKELTPYYPYVVRERLKHKRMFELANAAYELTPSQIAEMAPVYTREMNRLMHKRIVELANYYGDRLHSWDVVNESATDFGLGRMIPGDKICKSHYGLMPGDYTFESFKTAGRVFPENVIFNINDYKNDMDCVNQVNDLRSRGARIDIMGSQMHIFNPDDCLDIANGKPLRTPEIIRNSMETISKAGLPIHLSEITIPSPGDDERGREIQVVIARNLYRLWFSIEKMMGITWWNVVDGCGFRGEPSVSGLFTRNMEPKPVFYALDKLINHEWKTNMTVKAGENGNVKFRGFKGQYRLIWKDKSGKEQQAEFYLKRMETDFNLNG